jgi:hypothetical protein
MKILKSITSGESERWDEIPIIQLAKEMAKKQWFAWGNCTFPPYKTYQESLTDWMSLSNYKDRVQFQPQQMKIGLPFKSVHISFRIYFKNETSTIYYTQEIFSRRIRRRTARTCKEAIHKIEDAFSKLIPAMEAANTRKQYTIKMNNEQDVKREKLANDLGVVLSRHESNSVCWLYQKTERFVMTIGLANKGTDGEEDLYSIRDIRGEFTKEDLKRFMETFSTSTTTVAAQMFK